LNKKEVRVLTPVPMMGYGILEKWYYKGIEWKPDVITIDAGSTDSGPQKLGLGDMTCSREAYYKEFNLLLDTCQEKKIPVFISSAGGDGTNAHVDVFLDIIKEISLKKGYHFKIAAIYADMDKEYIKKKIRDGKVTPCGPLEDLTEEEVDLASNIVAQMGVEPFIRAMEECEDLDIIIAGRSYDPAPTAAYAIYHGFNPGLSWHMGKIMECGALCAEPAGRSIFGIMQEDGFILEPTNPSEKCKTYSVAAHTLYEKSHPYLLPGPGGILDLSGCTFEQISDSAVKVHNSKFIKKPYTVKLEGSKRVGFRTICIAGMRDPILIGQIDNYLERIKERVDEFARDINSYELIFHVYGKDGVMSECEPDTETVPKELCVIIETVAATQNEANLICNKARTELLHYPYEGRIATGGNCGFPFTPLEIPLGEVCKFNVYHVMEVDDANEVFSIKYLEV